MIPINKVFASTVGRKFIMSLTGLGLVIFILGHLVGNLQLLLPDGGELFNTYAHKLESLGPLLIVIEGGLALVVLLHAIVGIMLWKTSANARNQGYAMAESKGGNSRWNLSSRHMLLLGLVLITFMVIHVAQFKYGLFAGGHKTTMLHGAEVKDLYRLVVETFQNPLWVVFYVGVMLVLGFHLRHGLWSMLQSVGLMPAPYSNLIYVASAVIGAALALGFLILPIYLYLTHLPH